MQFSLQNEYCIHCIHLELHLIMNESKACQYFDGKEIAIVYALQRIALRNISEIIYIMCMTFMFITYSDFFLSSSTLHISSLRLLLMKMVTVALIIVISDLIQTKSKRCFYLLRETTAICFAFVYLFGEIFD